MRVNKGFTASSNSFKPRALISKFRQSGVSIGYGSGCQPLVEVVAVGKVVLYQIVYTCTLYKYLWCKVIIEKFSVIQKNLETKMTG